MHIDWMALLIVAVISIASSVVFTVLLLHEWLPLFHHGYWDS